MHALLQLTGLSRRFGATVALDGVDLSLYAGEVHALIGENGAGKSTLMNVLSGSIAPDAGTMTLSDQPYAPRNPRDARAHRIAHIHQELALASHLSVAENISLGLEPQRFGVIDRETMNDRARKLLYDFGRSEIDPSVRAGSLSLADQQVVEICRALAWDARIILMDEPTSSLQRANVERLFRLIRQLAERGIAIVYISHFLEEVREIATRFTVLRDGKSVATGELDSVSDQELISSMVGRSERGRPAGGSAGLRPAGVTQNDIILDVQNLSAPPLLRNASFTLHRGEIFGIAGLIGAGRTDLLRVLYGLQRRTSGTITLRGKTLAAMEPAAQIANGIGFLSEDRKGEGLALPMTIADNITMSRFETAARAGWIDLALQDTQASSVMSAMNVKADNAQSPVSRLSGGNQQKVALGRLLHQDPDILLLDEPARGIDAGSRVEIYEEITALAANGKSIVIVSSYLPELLGVCDRIAVMTRGVLSPARLTSEWSADSIMEVAISGFEARA